MHDLSWRGRLWKTCLIMKFLVLLLFVTTLQLSASVYSQEARVTVHLQNASFEEVVKVLESSTDFTFLYRDHQVMRIKNLSSRSAPLRELSPLRTVRASFPAYGSSNMTITDFVVGRVISFSTFIFIIYFAFYVYNWYVQEFLPFVRRLFVQ